MALIKGQNIDNSRPAVTTDDSDVVSVLGTHTITAAEAAAAAAGDVVQLVKFPAGAKVVDSIVYSSAAETGAIDLVELTDSAGAVIAASTIVAAGTVLDAALHRLDSPEVLDLAPMTVETYASVVLGATTPTLTAGTVITMQLSYRNSWLSN